MENKKFYSLLKNDTEMCAKIQEKWNSRYSMGIKKMVKAPDINSSVHQLDSFQQKQN